MLFRSTGLGKTEMAAAIEKLERQGDYLILRVRVALSFRDVVRVLKTLVRVSIIVFFFHHLSGLKRMLSIRGISSVGG